MSVGPSTNRHKKGLSCPWCPQKGRSDAIKRHMKTCPNRLEDGESVEAQPCSYNESSQAMGDDHELASQLAIGDEVGSINTSEIEQALEESKEPGQRSVLGKRPRSCSSQQLGVSMGSKPP